MATPRPSGRDDDEVDVGFVGELEDPGPDARAASGDESVHGSGADELHQLDLGERQGEVGS